MGKVYAKDLKPDLLNDVFMGEGFEEMLKEADEKNVEVIVGEFYSESTLEE